MEDLARTCKTLKRSPFHRLLHLHFHRPITPSLHSGTLNNPSRSSCGRLSCSALPSVLFVKRFRNGDEPYLYRIWRWFVKCRIHPIWIPIPICQRRTETRPIDSMSGTWRRRNWASHGNARDWWAGHPVHADPGARSATGSPRSPLCRSYAYFKSTGVMRGKCGAEARHPVGPGMDLHPVRESATARDSCTPCPISVIMPASSRPIRSILLSWSIRRRN